MDVKLFFDGREEILSAQSGKINKFEITIPAGTARAEFRMQIPLIDIHTLWYNQLQPGPCGRLMWNTFFDCGIHLNFPYIAFFNRSGVLRAGIGLSDLIDDCRFHAQVNQEKCTYDLTITLAVSPETEPFVLFADLRRDVDWQDSLASWRTTFPMPDPDKYPAAVWDPVYCTWYAVHGAVTQQWLEKAVPPMAELGFKTLIVDDGWCYDDFKRVSPETISTWYEMIGDWKISEKKFPSFKEHVKKIQSLGVKYMLWTAPHLWGNKSELYKKHPDCVHEHFVEGYRQMDVAHTEVVDELADDLRRLASENGLDGLKIDFLDIVPPDVDAPNARNTLRLIKKLTDGLKEDNPEALIEFRQRYASPQMLEYGTQFRAGDAPFDWQLNFGRTVEIRLGIGDGYPVHADPAYWAPDEEAENVSRHMIAMLAGVPMLSMDPETLSERDRNIIRFWIDFYNRNRKLLNHGKWHFHFGISDVDAAVVDNDEERLVILAAGARVNEMLPDDGRKVTLLNLSNYTLKIDGAETFGPDGKAAVPGEIIPGGGGVIAG